MSKFINDKEYIDPDGKLRTKLSEEEHEIREGMSINERRERDGLPPVPPHQSDNLKPWNPDTAREAQLKSAESRKRNRLVREQMVDVAKALKSLAEDGEAISAVDVMRVNMITMQQQGDLKGASDLAAKIAPYESPTLSKVESRNENINLADLTDEEFAEELKKLENGED